MMEQPEKTERLYISDIEEQLVADPQGHFRDQLMRTLFDQLVELKALRDRGALPDAFSKIEALILAVSAAGDMVAKTWKKHHSQLTH